MALLGSVASVTILVGACADNESSIFVRGLLAPPIATDGVCTYTPDPSQPQLLGATVDVAFRSSYSGVVLVGNHLVARQDVDQARSETSRVQLQGAEVTVIDARDGRQLSTFTSLGTGFTDPSTGAQPGFGIVALTLVNEAALAAIGNVPFGGVKLIARFRVFGRTLGGDEVESGEYQQPVDVCNGCLVSFPPESVDTTLRASTGQLNCQGVGGTVTAPCVLGQDGPVDCRLCQGNPVCDPNRPIE